MQYVFVLGDLAVVVVNDVLVVMMQLYKFKLVVCHNTDSSNCVNDVYIHTAPPNSPWKVGIGVTGAIRL